MGPVRHEIPYDEKIGEMSHPDLKMAKNCKIRRIWAQQQPIKATLLCQSFVPIYKSAENERQPDVA